MVKAIGSIEVSTVKAAIRAFRKHNNPEPAIIEGTAKPGLDLKRSSETRGKIVTGV